MNFPYVYEITSLDSLEINDIGNCSLKCFNDLGDSFYLDIKTELGWTTIKQLGPLKLDSFNDAYNYSFSYLKKEFNEKNLHKLIDSFLNDNKRCITQAFIIDSDEFLTKLEEMPL